MVPMPRGKRGGWSTSELGEAVEKVNSAESLRSVSKETGIARNTIKAAAAAEQQKKKLRAVLGRPPVASPLEEATIVS